MAKKEQVKLTSIISITQPKSKIAEQFRMIRTNIKFSMHDERLKTLMITSTTPQEGKTTISINIAAVMADEGKKVLLVDADMRRPQVAAALHLPQAKGLSTLIADSTTLVTDVIQEVKEVAIDVITSGPIPPNPSELLGTQRMSAIIKELEATYDLIIFDVPPMLSVTDAQVMANKVGGVIMVIRHNVAYTADVIQAKHLLDLVNANVVGAIYNGAESNTGERSYYYEYKADE